MLTAAFINNLESSEVKHAMTRIIERKIAGEYNDAENKQADREYALLRNRLDFLEKEKVAQKTIANKTKVDLATEKYANPVLSYLDSLPKGFAVSSRIIAEAIDYQFVGDKEISITTSLRDNVLNGLQRKDKIYKFSKVGGRGDLYAHPNNLEYNEEGRQADLFMLAGKQKPHRADQDDD